MLVFGHRGARGEAPENTLAGFRHAQRVGVSAFELDVRLSADGELMVIHDATVDRTTNTSGPVAAFTAADLSKMDARGEFPDWPESAGVPRLSEVLDLFAESIRFAIEIKTDTPDRLDLVCRLLSRAIDDYRLSSLVTVTSFDPTALEIMQQLAPAVPQAFIGAYDTPAILDTALRLGCQQADIPHARGSAAVVREAQARGLRVVGWLGNTNEDLQTLIDWGVDGITSDYPTRAIGYLREQGIASDSWK